MELHPYAQAWAARDLDGLLSLLSKDVAFHSPFVSEPGFEGRDATQVIFAIAFDVLKGDRYTHDFGDERSRVLVADSRVLDKPIKTSTVLEFDADGSIREIWMMVRPLTGLTALAEAVGRAIQERDPQVHELAAPLAGLASVIDRAAARLVGELNRARTEIHARPLVP